MVRGRIRGKVRGTGRGKVIARSMGRGYNNNNRWLLFGAFPGRMLAQCALDHIITPTGT